MVTCKSIAFKTKSLQNIKFALCPSRCRLDEINNSYEYSTIVKTHIKNDIVSHNHCRQGGIKPRNLQNIRPRSFWIADEWPFKVYWALLRTCLHEWITKQEKLQSRIFLNPSYSKTPHTFLPQTSSYLILVTSVQNVYFPQSRHCITKSNTHHTLIKRSPLDNRNPRWNFALSCLLENLFRPR